MYASRALPLRRSFYFLMAGLSVVLTACSDASTAPVVDVPVASVMIVGSTDALAAGEQRTLSVQLRDASGAELPGRTVSWSSSDELVATVSATGRVTAVSAGTVTIVARAEGRAASAELEVRPAPVAEIRLSETQFTLRRNEVRLVHADLRDAQGRPVINVNLDWTSEDPSVATVTSSGYVRAVASGETRVIARVGSRQAVVIVRVPLTIARVEVVPSSEPLSVGSNVQFAVKAFDDRGREIDASQAVWSSSDPSVALVSSSGVVTGVSRGSAVIRAAVQYASGVTTVTVRSNNWHFESNLFQPPEVLRSDTVTQTGQVLVINESRLVNAWFSFNTSTRAWTFSGEVVHSERNELQGNVIWRETGRQTVQDHGTGREYDWFSGAILMRSARTDTVAFRFLPFQDRATLQGTVRGFPVDVAIPLQR